MNTVPRANGEAEHDQEISNHRALNQETADAKETIDEDRMEWWDRKSRLRSGQTHPNLQPLQLAHNIIRAFVYSSDFHYATAI